MSIDQWIAAAVLPLALWILLSGLDDLLVDAVFVLRRRPYVRLPTACELAQAAHRRIAIFVPLWREHAVIGRMLDHNISVIDYHNYDVFVGVYPNDSPTIQAVSAACERYPQVHMAVCPHDGPTSKADCLNWIYHRMTEVEREQRTRFEVIVTHDAEDIIHPASLGLIDYFSDQFDMVQIPVLPLPTPLHEWVHGLYCDEFAEYQSKDIPVRQVMGGFIPSNGVGAGFTRPALEALAATRGGRIFEPECLTEDYENGFRVHAASRAQLFVPIFRQADGLIATREFFPRLLRAAVRQRARWVAGISLQGWERHGWRVPLRQVYWFWRDRKGLLGNALSPLANVISGYAAAGWLMSAYTGHPWRLGAAMAPWQGNLCWAIAAISVIQLCFRGYCVARLYGIRFACGVPVRTMIGNWLNFVATLMAMGQFTMAHIRHRGLAWRKTEHWYPDSGELERKKPRIGEILVRMRCLQTADVEAALSECPKDLRLGEYLLHNQKISEQSLYEALSLLSGIPLGEPQPEDRRTGRLLPAQVAAKWNVLPLRVEAGVLHVGVAEFPSSELLDELRRYSTLEVRCCLLPASAFASGRGGAANGLESPAART